MVTDAYQNIQIMCSHFNEDDIADEQQPMHMQDKPECLCSNAATGSMGRCGQLVTVLVARAFACLQQASMWLHIPFSLFIITDLLGVISDPDQFGFLCCSVHACRASRFLFCQHLFYILGCIRVAAYEHNILVRAAPRQWLQTDTHCYWLAMALCNGLVHGDYSI